MNKSDIYNYLDLKNVVYQVTDHKAVFNMEELNDVNLLYPDSIAKNIFICDDKKTKYYLICIKGNKRIDLKNFRKVFQTRPLSFASENELFEILKLHSGSVTPLGLLNDENRIVELFIDDKFLEGNQIIGCHPNENTSTIWINVKDLEIIINQHGNNVKYFKVE